MFRLKKQNTVSESSQIDGTSAENIGLSPVDSVVTDNSTTTNQEQASNALSLSVQEVQGEDGPVNIEVKDVTTIKFDISSGIDVTDKGNGEILIDIEDEVGSSFSTLYVDGKQTLTASGQDSIQLIAGDNIVIDTVNSHTGSSSNAVKINTKHKGIYVLDGTDNSSDFPLFKDMIDNGNNYRGALLYLLDVGPTKRPDPFLWADKFYFNEGGEWFESPFAIGRLLDDL